MYGNVNKPYEERVLIDKKYGIEYFTYCMILWYNFYDVYIYK